MLFSLSALDCIDGFNDGYNRVLKALRLTSTTTVFGHVNFDKWQQVCMLLSRCCYHPRCSLVYVFAAIMLQNVGKSFVISQLHSNRFFNPASINASAVLPLEIRSQPLEYPAPGTGALEWHMLC